MKPRFRKSLHSGRIQAAMVASGALLFFPPLLADIIERPAATLSLVNDELVAVVGESTDLAVLSNDTIENAGTFTLAIPATSDQGGVLEVVGTTIRYTPPANLLDGDSDSFEYTVTEEDFTASGNGSFSIISADMSGLGNTMTDPGNGGEYTVTNVSGFNNTVWDGVAYSSADINGNIDTSSLYRHVIEPDLSVDIEGCSAGSEPAVDVTIRWNLTKTSGNSAGYEASIAWGSNFPLGNDFTGNGAAFVSEVNWSAGDTRELVLTLEDLSATALNSLQIGLWAQDAQSSDPGDENNWLSNSVSMSYSLDTSSCQLASASATASITLGPPPDSDADALPDSSDLDDDNDGIADVLEQDNGADRDTDGDGVVDRLDLDSDNDGLLDVQESGAEDIQSLDTDGNGRIDGVVGANGLADTVETGADSGMASYALNDSDNDGVPDYLDLDSDNDGITDMIEVGASTSHDGNQDARLDGSVGNDGLVDTLQTDIDNGGYDFDNNGTADAVPDSDGDGTADFRDLDSDGDGLTDLLEAGGSDDSPAGGDGRVDEFADADGNGLDDAMAAVPLTVADTDGDGMPDYRDTDSDNDGLSDAEEGSDDSDGNGIPDYLQANAKIETGLGGGGCTMSSRAPLDPVLPMLALISLGALIRRYGS